jgi:O-antigen biosynthesis protein WbqP
MQSGTTIIRLMDLFLSGLGLLVLAPVLLVLFVLGLFDTGSPLFYQLRVGKAQKPFVLIKFRTMKKSTASLASHLVDVSAVTTYGHFLRRSKMDELPQLWNVLRGDMSLVGPRPGLPNQEELIRERAKLDVFSVRPGITGLAQVQGIDMSDPKRLAEVDQKMITTLRIAHYAKYILQTLMGRGAGDRVARKDK